MTEQLLVDWVFPLIGQTVWLGRGISVETGETVSFGGDWRPMADLYEAVEAEGPQDVLVEDWQVTGRYDQVVES